MKIRHLLLLLSLASTTALPMGTWVDKVMAWDKALANSKLFNVAIVGGSILLIGCFMFKKDKTWDKEKGKIKDYVTDFAYKELKAIGVTQKIPVYLKQHTSSNFHNNGATNGREISLTLSEEDAEDLFMYKKLQERYKNTQSETEKQKIEKEMEVMYRELATVRATIQHEGGHILHHDVKKGVVLSILSPLLYIGLMSGLNRLFIPSGPESRKQYLLASFLTPAASFISLMILQAKYHQHTELCADDVIQDDPKLLECRALLFSDHAKREKKQGFWYWLKEYLFSNHPSDFTRAKRFSRRLAQLEQQQLKLSS